MVGADGSICPIERRRKKGMRRIGRGGEGKGREKNDGEEEGK